MDHAVLQPLRVGLSRFAAYINWGVLRDQPYEVVIEPLIRGSVDAQRQHCPAKRLTPMGLFVNGRKTAIIMAKTAKSKKTRRVQEKNEDASF